MQVYKFFILIFLFGNLLFGDDKSTANPEPPAPWLTGPLIVPQATVIPYGHFEIETYLYFTTNTGTYNSNWHPSTADHNFFSFNPQVYFYLGLTPWMDINIFPQFFYNTISNQSSVNFGDLVIALEFQLLSDDAIPYFPGIEFSIGESFPTGPYQKLDPNKLLTDQTGNGTYGTTFSLELYKVYHVTGLHFLSTTYSAAYTIATPTKVKGFNAYGGGYGTDGKVDPGNTFEGIISFEFTLTQNWALAIDNVYTHVNRTTFSGTPGQTSSELLASNSLPSSEQISFAPAIEYNFSANLGIIAGCWFTAWGRNSNIFRSGAIGLIYNY